MVEKICRNVPQTMPSIILNRLREAPRKKSKEKINNSVKTMAATIDGIEQQVQDVKEYTGQAKTAAEKALLSEQRIVRNPRKHLYNIVQEQKQPRIMQSWQTKCQEI